MKIVRICPSIGNKKNRIGMESHFYNLSNVQAKLGVDVTVIAGSKENDFRNEDGFKIYEVKDTLPFAYLSLSNSFFKKFKELDKKENFELVHGHNAVVYGFSLHRINKPFVYTMHGSILNYKYNSFLDLNGIHPYLFYIFSRSICKKADVITVGSSETRIDVIKHYGIEPDKVHFIPAGVDLKKFRPKLKQKIKQELGISGNMVLYVGRFAKIKNLKMLLEAAKKVTKECPETKFVLLSGVKTDDDYYNIMNLRKKLRIENSVLVIPPVPHDIMPLYYSACDVFAHTSFAEAVPKVIIEAMATGKPVVATDVIGTRDAVDDKTTGFLVPVGSSEEFAEKISLLLSDPVLRNKFGKTAREKTEKKFDWKNIANEYIKIYRKLV